ncbi:S-adenosyl-L-methionine-dependent methyltransferase [Schizopora paradoxa]|uniref:Protein-lysine N-methyltransferase EFM4 n=1 Tax=Schizopora paradoxa TaxID=27342 RepID=A0A0H2RTH3_9AGAM|nr:S-adenosyl-L-methionine-dependent methyltransferase [Schizopora paradoxa]
MSTDDSFSPSKLGTKEHWDNVYESELSTFKETGDEGEIWFGEEIVEKMCDWVVEHISTSQKPRILDVGSGNGNLLFSLSAAGYDNASLVGIDYSMDAVHLAQSIASRRSIEGMKFACVDFLQDGSTLPAPTSSESREIHESGKPSNSSRGKWDLVLDKGTYDAIALSERKDGDTPPLRVYASRIGELVLPGGFFMITSCNFTEEELLSAFQRPEYGLLFHSRIEHRTLTFGGVQGSTYTTVAFQKSGDARSESKTVN